MRFGVNPSQQIQNLLYCIPVTVRQQHVVISTHGGIAQLVRAQDS